MARKVWLMVLALTLLMAVPALAQKPGNKAPTPLEGAPSATAASAHRQFSGFGQYWNAMSDKEHDAFMRGVVTAFRIYCMEAVASDKSQSPQDTNKHFMECFASNFPYQPGLVKEAMNSLYQDKANNIIPFDYMFGLALLKVKGDPIDDRLARLRQDSEKLLKGGK